MKKYKKEFISLLKKEGLDNIELYFSDYDTFEEIPLFSRWANIHFLDEIDFDEKNKILICEAIELVSNILKEAPDYLGEQFNEYFICVSITNWEDIEDINCITPNIYISKRKTWLLSYLNMEKKNSYEEGLIDTYLSSLGLNEYISYVTHNFDKESRRVYIINKNFFPIN